MRKLGKLWATENTIKVSNLSMYIVERLELQTQGPVLIKQKDIEYHVYGKNKEEYKNLLEKIKQKLEKNHNEI